MKLAGPLNMEIGWNYSWVESFLLFTHSTSTEIGAFLDQVESGKKRSGTKFDSIKEEKIEVCQNMKKNLDVNNSNNPQMKK